MRVFTVGVFFFILSPLCSQTKFQKDFDHYWQTVNENFGYFDTQKTNWQKVRSIYQPVVDTITTTHSFVQFLEEVNNELYNGHISLNTNLPSSNRLIPTGSDLWVKYEKDQFIISAIREGYNADRAGLKQGMRIIKYNDEPIHDAVKFYLPKSVNTHDNQMYEYAGNMLLAGRHNIKRSITVLLNGIGKTYQPDTLTAKPDYNTLIEFKILSSNIGYIRINNSLGNSELIRAFDGALDKLFTTKGMIIDLRETPSGGNTTVARAIMGRFIEKEMPYQRHSIPNEEIQFGVKRSWIELVSPRGKIYKKPLIILVNRWTGSMGEGIAIGFDGMKRATVIGDKMAGLIGAIYSFTLPETKISFSIPVEKLFHVNGMPREQFEPRIKVTDNRNVIPVAVQLLSKKSSPSP